MAQATDPQGPSRSSPVTFGDVAVPADFRRRGHGHRRIGQYDDRWIGHYDRVVGRYVVRLERVVGALDRRPGRLLGRLGHFGHFRRRIGQSRGFGRCDRAAGQVDR